MFLLKPLVWPLKQILVSLPLNWLHTPTLLATPAANPILYVSILAGNPNVDRVVIINTNTGNTFFHRLGQYNQMIVLARSGNDVPTVIQEMNRVYGSDSFGIVSPAAIIQA